MARPADPAQAILQALMRQGGSLNSAELQAQLGVSQPSPFARLAQCGDDLPGNLLVCEHLALQTLLDAGVSAAKTQILTGAGRVFLEAERFDRTAQGRVGMVSLMVFDAEYVGAMDNWAAAASDVRISADFRQIAAENLSQIGL
jgi:hypothetical protein